MTTIEQAAWHAFRRWAAYRGWHICAHCGENAYCGRRRQIEKWTCIDCWDVR